MDCIQSQNSRETAIIFFLFSVLLGSNIYTKQQKKELELST